jgi:hypothetical protein
MKGKKMIETFFIGAQITEIPGEILIIIKDGREVSFGKSHLSYEVGHYVTNFGFFSFSMRSDVSFNIFANEDLYS